MNLLFLDFDGVINNPATEHRPYVWPEWHQNAGLVSNTRWIEPDLIAIVERIRAAFDADIVISSTWRQHYTLEQLRDILECHIPRSRVIDVTPKLYSDRGTEIEYSLRKYSPRQVPDLRRLHAEFFLGPPTAVSRPDRRRFGHH